MNRFKVNKVDKMYKKENTHKKSKFSRCPEVIKMRDTPILNKSPEIHIFSILFLTERHLDLQSSFATNDVMTNDNSIEAYAYEYNTIYL